MAIVQGIRFLANAQDSLQTSSHFDGRVLGFVEKGVARPSLYNAEF